MVSPCAKTYMKGAWVYHLPNERDEMNQTLRDKLVSMEEEDLRVRDELAADGSLSDGYHPRMEEVHRRNAARLREIIDSINNRQLPHRHCHDWKTARERKLCPSRYIRQMPDG
jgi:hypothetical protein